VAAGELFEVVGRTADARRAYAAFTALSGLFATNGVPLAPEPALFAADRGQPDQALRLAEAAVRAGPTPAAQDAYAWALMANGRAADALNWSDKATSAGAPNALFAFHRGMIESSLGRDGAARDDLATALRTNPWFSPRLAPLARVTLTALAGPQ
jgi:tetratricopeptide (TPR) repeat protein